jgi:uncharacterized Zn finger protein
LKCPRCHNDITTPVLFGRHGPYVSCRACGKVSRVMREPQPPAPRRRPRMTKKDRRRLRAQGDRA